MICKDCGIDAWFFLEDGGYAHEDFYVHDALWDAVAPDDLRAKRERPSGIVRYPRWYERGAGFALCIGCFENRLVRQLVRSDFKGPPLTDILGTPYRPSQTILGAVGLMTRGSIRGSMASVLASPELSMSIGRSAVQVQNRQWTAGETPTPVDTPRQG